MKKASEYLQDELSKLDDIDQPWLDYNVYDGRATPIFEAIKQAQKDAVEYALEQAAENAKMIRSINKLDDELISIHEIHAYDCYFENGDVSIDRHSILSLKDKLFKEL